MGSFSAYAVDNHYLMEELNPTISELRKEYRYLVKALKSYREVSYGQFDQETEYEVEETQDAATAIERLLQIIDNQQFQIRKLQQNLEINT